MRQLACFAFALVALHAPFTRHSIARASTPQLRPHQYRGVLFVACAAGDPEHVYETIKRFASETRLPLHIVRWEWGTGDIDADSRDQRRQRESGRRLAQYIKGLPPQHGKIYLVGYGGGAGVMLAAAEQADPGKVERVILFGANLSHGYDLRPALARTRQGIDNFYSSAKSLIDVVTFNVESSGGGRYANAGSKGFRFFLASQADAHLYRNLRQYAWKDRGRLPDHNGGQVGYDRTSFVTGQLLPLLRSSLATP